MDASNISRIIAGMQDHDPMRGAPPLYPPAQGGTSEGMDPWQQSVEKRLDSLDGRAQRTETHVSDIRTDVAALKVTVSHLPTKEFIVKSTLGALAAVAAISAFVQWVLSAHPFG